MAEAGIGLVYGGGSLGLMGEVARAVLTGGGHVTGIIPEFLVNRERMLTDVNELIVTANMHERKMTMFERSDGFAALPGGIGTLEELVEQITWAQLGRHRKPIAIANIKRFWEPLLALLAHMQSLAFTPANPVVELLVVEQVEDIFPKLVSAARAVSEAETRTAVAETVERM